MILEEGAPKDLIKSWNNVSTFAEHRFAEVALLDYISDFVFDEAHIPEAMCTWNDID
ncbi:hypothetical protein JVT61DRAFT_2893 [Boletus reticuloceps]|uniref:Uncharacterized protein n=1 Tax=Boletus reticuloceps TaxID=495285 RepID=A0A8I3AA84_9AGAM|nr:hypothetical protein JVT61DRAFT_2893 [Boletus reticuloceps]